jgi:hypothetical protein
MNISIIKKSSLILLATLFAVVGLMTAFPAPTSALSGSDFNAARIIDDPIFFDSNRMGVWDVQNFLNSKVPVCDTNGDKMRGSVTRRDYAASKGVSPPFTCLKDYRQDTPDKPGDQYCRGLGGGNKSAAQIIKDVADVCSISPMVLIVLLQKEQSLITDDWPWPVQYRSATGFGCPDTAACDSQYYGFFNQVYSAGRQFQVYAQKPQLFGYRAGRSNYIQYNPNTGCSGTGVSIMGNSTAGLYNYTPYQPNPAALNNLYGTGDGCSSYGNRNFWRLYYDWFGSPITSACAYDNALPVITDVAMRKIYPNVDSGNLIIYSGTNTQCIESHTWGDNFSSWKLNTASNQKVLIPNDCALKFADLSGDGKDEPVLVCFRNTGSGKVEFHVWNYDMRGWIVHGISNLPVVDPNSIAIDFGDLNGDGKDEPIAIGYRNTSSGKVELHLWNDGLQSWQSHITTNLPVIDPANMNIGFADMNGDGADEAIAIGVGNTATGRIEFHVWNPGQWSWQGHYVSNQPLVNMNQFGIVFGNFRGRGADQGVLVGKQQTATGRIEFHVWNDGFGSWSSHNASNQTTF